MFATTGSIPRTNTAPSHRQSPFLRRGLTGACVSGFMPPSPAEERALPVAEPVPPPWIDGSLRIGIHASISGGYRNALESAQKLGCNALQIFSASPKMWQGGPARIPEQDAAAFRARREGLRLGPLVIHANYLVNLAAAQPMLRTRSIQAFPADL